MSWAFGAIAAAAIGVGYVVYRGGTQRNLALGNPTALEAHALFAGSMAIMALALVPPIASIAGHLYWMLQVQTLLLRFVAPMMIMLAAPGANLHAGLPERWRKRIPVRDDDPFFMDDERPRGVVAFLARPSVATALFIAVFAFWQIPPCLDATVLHPALAIVMVLTFAASALLFWWRVLDPRSPPFGPGYAARLAMLLLATLTQIGLGAYLTVKTTVLYSAYDTVGRLYHIHPLTDETLGGATVWVPGSIICVLAAIAIIHLWGKHETRVDARRTSWSGTNSDALLFPTTGDALVENARPKNRILAIGAAVFAVAMFAFVIVSGVLNHYDRTHGAAPTSQIWTR
ncbi:MAG: cytochrome c oxidase assembly protein [Pseudolabrys sp.]